MSFNIENLIGVTTILEDDGLSHVWVSIPDTMKKHLKKNKDILEMFGDLNALISKGFQDLGFPLICARFKVNEFSKNDNDQIIPQSVVFISNEHVPLTFIIISSRIIHIDILIDISEEMGNAIEDFSKIYNKYLKQTNNHKGIRQFLKENNGLNLFPTYIDHKINMLSQNSIDKFFNFAITPNWLKFTRKKITLSKNTNDIEEIISISYNSNIFLHDFKVEFNELFFQYVNGLLNCIQEGINNLGNITKRNYRDLRPLIDFCVFKAESMNDSYLICQGLHNVYQINSNEIIIDSILFSGINSYMDNLDKNVNYLKNRFNNLLLKNKNKHVDEIVQGFNTYFQSNFPYMEKS
ncbi:MAG: hypothetical protein ACTSVY_15460 [Candidatus Helarchaeota archaeon]